MRPVIIYGAGIHLAGAKQEAVDFAHKTGIPVAPTWGALDLFPSDDPLVIGSFGTHGTRAGNFAVQNATHILSVGSRLDSKATGTPIETFAREAQITMVDIDQREIDKFGDRVTGLCEDAKVYFETNIVPLPDVAWLAQIKRWKEKYPVVLPEYEQEEGVNPYVFLRELSHVCEEGEIIVTDTGCAVAWVSQGFRWKKGQRFIHAFNQTPMGYGLPAAIGAHYATGKRVVLITGDGSLMMSFGELATIGSKKLPIKIVMFNNQGHAMCRQTEREWLEGKYCATGLPDLSFPQFRRVAWDCGLATWIVDESDYANEKRRVQKDSLKQVLEAFMSDVSKACFMEVVVSPDADVVPKVKYGYPNEDGHPLLPREELKEQMLIPCVS